MPKSTPIASGPWIASFGRPERNYALVPDPDNGDPPPTAYAPKYPAFNVWHTPTRSRRKHLVTLWREYCALRWGKVGRFEQPRRSNAREIPALPAVRWIPGRHARDACGADLNPIEAHALGMDAETALSNPDEPFDRSTRHRVSVPPWLPREGGEPVPAWQGVVDPGPGGSTTWRAQALRLWARHVLAHRPRVKIPGRLPNGTTAKPHRTKPDGPTPADIVPPPPPVGWSGQWSLVTTPAGAFAIPGSVRPDWRRVVAERLGVPRLPTGCRRLTVKTPPEGVEVIGAGCLTP